MLAMCAMVVLIYTAVIRAALQGRTLPPVQVPVDAPALNTGCGRRSCWCRPAGGAGWC